MLWKARSSCLVGGAASIEQGDERTGVCRYQGEASFAALTHVGDDFDIASPLAVGMLP